MVSSFKVSTTCSEVVVLSAVLSSAHAAEGSITASMARAQRTLVTRLACNFMNTIPPLKTHDTAMVPEDVFDPPEIFQQKYGSVAK
ncbi:hypothetical protein, partial [uncultured Subdoligranulum sp.]|uniref:hypothetical protein n=1 Tax=uncultured Subdoligranulum sp. TaxID=512298 RepID=UPI0026260FA4